MLMFSNVHERTYPVPPAVIGELLDSVSGPDDRIWPRNWPPIRFDRPLQVGAVGGHGAIRYSVSSYQPGRRVEFRCGPGGSLSGWHAFEVRDGAMAGSTELRHFLVLRLGPLQRLVLPLTVEKLHDALLEDLLDRVGDEIGHPPIERARWSPWVRLMRRAITRKASTKNVEQPAPTTPAVHAA